MGLVLRVKNADFSASAVAVVMPVMDDLAYCNFFGGNEANLVRNLAPNGELSIVSGAPQVNDNSVVLGGGYGYIQTQVDDDSEVSIITVVRALEDVGGAIVVGNTSSASQVHAGTTQGTALYFTQETAGDGALAARFNSAQTDGSTSSGVIASLIGGVTEDQFCCLAASRKASTKARTVKNLSTAAQNVVNGSLDPDYGEQFRIGRGYNLSTFPDDVEVAFVAIYKRALSDAEFSAMYDYLKGLFSSKSIEI
ncbi:hypothetical protein [Spongiibacter marinus]|uniref:hypothetical protein n=1 Tax=Spongiibacter marinus TaxID=354246 RepID=UPI00195FA19E|nr:hypothetical protein [Spongiibacter marinus]MBM7423820.1 hypothetical protein [Spongiibacter marinus]